MTGRLRIALVAAVSAALLPLTSQAGAAMVPAQPQSSDAVTPEQLGIHRVPSEDEAVEKCRKPAPEKKTIHLYSRGGPYVLVPMRCGRYNRDTGKGYGWRKIKRKHGWSDVKVIIAQYTLEHPDRINQHGSSYAYFHDFSSGTWKVVFDTRTICQSCQHKMKGIITAYQLGG